MAAYAAMAPRGHQPESNCTECRSNPSKRAEWGCDEPTSEPQIEIRPCLFCGGETPSCTECHGTNSMPYYRCIRRPEVEALVPVLSACALVEHGVLPAAGGWQDQAHTFVQAYPIVVREIQHWREVRQEQALADAKRKQNRR